MPSSLVASTMADAGGDRTEHSTTRRGTLKAAGAASASDGPDVATTPEGVGDSDSVATAADTTDSDPEDTGTSTTSSDGDRTGIPDPIADTFTGGL